MATYKSKEAAGPEDIDLTIHVIPVVDQHDLDEGDLDDDGRCLVDGKYRLSLDMGEEDMSTLHNRALEMFHSINGVYEPDHFRFLVSTFSENMDTSLRRHLGHWCVMSDRPVNWTSIDQNPEHGVYL